MKKIGFLLPLFFIYINCHAQNWFNHHNQGEKLSGYILGIAGDTIAGSIKYDYPVIMQKRISFYPSENIPEPVIYTPEDIRGFSLDDKLWISTTVIMDTYDGRYNFQRFGILESGVGPLMLIRVFDEWDKLKKKINSAEAEKELKRVHLHFPDNSIDQLYIKKTDGAAEPVSSRAFKKSFVSRMRSMVGDNQTLMSKIESKEYTIKDVYTIASVYNEWYEANLK
jgi:hypothetical protein